MHRQVREADEAMAGCNAPGGLIRQLGVHDYDRTLSREHFRELPGAFNRDLLYLDALPEAVRRMHIERHLRPCIDQRPGQRAGVDLAAPDQRLQVDVVDVDQRFSP
jgi:hypothetical protein